MYGRLIYSQFVLNYACGRQLRGPDNGGAALHPRARILALPGIYHILSLPKCVP